MSNTALNSSVLSAKLETTGLSFDLSSTSSSVLPSVWLTSLFLSLPSSYKNVLNSNSALKKSFKSASIQ